ncbi:hypothetical protein SSX86_004582 [Deinandra increscens subsp. villosa]|uniref:Ubiquitin-like protease family profile domain-containing protein n=1 Tax=Deinandra increscens subsp. villosa TaxID=3103831 RepID=A0AAP0DJU3_9ASTR
MDKSWSSSDTLSNACDEGVNALLEFAQSNNSNSEEDSKSQRGPSPTRKSEANKGKIVVTYNKRGVPIGDGAKKLSTFEGTVARSMVPITYESWLDVGEETKEACWKYVLDKSKKAKTVRAHNKYNHRLSRKGYAGLITEIMQETGKAEEEIDRVVCWKRAREMKTGGFDPAVKKIVEKIEKLQKTEKIVDVPCGTEDVLTKALGTEEQRGRVRGMGKFVMPHQYFFLPKTVKHYLDIEKMKMDRRLNKVKDELEILKRGINNNISEGSSRQMWDEEDVEDEAPKEPVDNSCYLAVDVPSNIVAKGTVVNYSVSGENIEVMMETCVEGEALLPIPIEEVFIEKVKDAFGYILSWPRHLVIRCSDLNKMVAKHAKKDVEKNAKKDEESNTKKGMEKEEAGKEIESKKEKKRKRELDEENEKELIIIRNKNDKNCGSQLTTGDTINELKASKTKVNEIETMQRRMTRGQRKTRIRMEKSVALKMVAVMVDGQVSKVDSIKVQCEDDVFGYESYTYLNWNDFDKVFTMDEVSGAVVTSYTMYLYEQIKNGPKRDHGICFMTPTATMQSERKAKSKNVNDSSRSIAYRLSTRKDNDIILLPYNPGRHWVLGVLDMKTTTCYYLDSLRPSTVNVQFRKIIHAAMGLYAVQSGSKKKAKLKWVNSRCPCQPGSTECGYYVLRFMKEIVEEGIEILVNDNIGGTKNEYTDDDLDEIREEWSTFVANFIFR